MNQADKTWADPLTKRERIDRLAAFRDEVAEAEEYHLILSPKAWERMSALLREVGELWDSIKEARRLDNLSTSQEFSLESDEWAAHCKAHEAAWDDIDAKLAKLAEPVLP